MTIFSIGIHRGSRLISQLCILVAFQLPSAIKLHQPQTAEAALIHIHKGTNNEPTSSLDTNPIVKEAAIEFRSPMKRIVDLISQRGPIIVVSSSDSTVQGLQTSSSVQQTEQAGKQTQQQPLTMASNAISIGGNQWALVDANGQIQAPNFVAAQQQSQPQHQQHHLVSTGALPIASHQYYLASPPQFGVSDGLSSPITLMPAAFNLGPIGSNYDLVSGQHVDMPPEASLLQSALQQHNTDKSEDRAQPVFLSSYVPEVSLGQTSAGSVQETSGEAKPNSIQQVQRSQTQQSPKPSDSKKEAESMDDRLKNDSNGPDSTMGDDIEEVGPSQSAQQEPSDEPSQNSSGSLSYEDKYDSDRDGPKSNEARGASGTNNQARTSASKSEKSASNGLVSVGLNEDCLQCICRASSGCDKQLRCITVGSEDKYCGPFQLTEEYWSRAGSPGDPANSGFTSFEDCANDEDCAVETVVNYMRKYHRDCDGDDNITCMDYARLHRLAPNECENLDKLSNYSDGYWAKFQHCADGYNRSRNGDEEEI